MKTPSSERKDTILRTTANLHLPRMTVLERRIFEFTCKLNPQSMYSMGLEDLAEEVFVPSKENLDRALQAVGDLKRAAGTSNPLASKYLDSIETQLLFTEPGPGAGQIVDIVAGHLIKEGIKPARLAVLLERLEKSLTAWSEYIEGKEYTIPQKILAQYQILGAKEILDIVLKESDDPTLRLRAESLKDSVSVFASKYSVQGFTDGEFSEVMKLMKEQGARLGREHFYDRALKHGFDYAESPSELEDKALEWIGEDLPKMNAAVTKLSQQLGCPNDPESVNKELRARPGVSGKEMLEATKKMRPVVQKLVSKLVVGMNSRYDARVVETPPYLSAILPTGAAQGYDSLTKKPYQLFYITTDPKRAPPGGFADLMNLLVHEEYGHCLHFSNTSAAYAAKPGIIEMLPSLHGGTTSEGLAFQRELEFLELVEEIAKKPGSKLSQEERAFVNLANEYGGFEQVLLELQFVTYKQRIIRFLRVVGDSRINSGKQDLPEFLNWAEEKTRLSQRTVFYQIYPAHEGIFPGYATCYAVVGQQIRQIQKKLQGDRRKLVKFNAFACSMGCPARSVYVKRLQDYAPKISKRRSSVQRKKKNQQKKRAGSRRR